MRGQTPDHVRYLVSIVHETSWFLQALKTASSLQLNDWCIGAGAVRNLVWDHLHGYKEPSTLPDVDLAYFAADEAQRVEVDHLAKLRLAAPETAWEVVNQSHVHCWYEKAFGYPVHPFHSLQEAIASWPEFATCVGVTLSCNGKVEVIAPYGLDDLFGMIIRHNPVRASTEEFRIRLSAKRYAERWPMARVVKE